MAQEIKLKVKKEVDGELVTKPTTYEIEKLNFFKFMGVTKLVKDIITEVKKDENLAQLFNQMFNMSEEETEEQAALMNKSVLSAAAESFQTLAVYLPEQALELLSALSGVETDVLGNQEIDAILNVYDAVLEVNDIEELANRVKKSLALTKSAFKLKALTEKVVPQA
ncbi:hypothetical protein [Priestia aryabhattai]